ncbi:MULTISPECIES: cellulose synthase complex periplasmic endoglucanase BcsZ [Variovorax]|uniref:cellulose synthase complex periplasmic endoglucanase BcsZ n=1 Tax=Variovorax TaxID=34072 RepID=UPI00119C8088|nr:cellulose synthase complex periplasmic endoglucanase BcsZ [Variovorax paradoxus]MDR6518194.1 endoglucanase [Variovorax paradoxus]
MQRSKTVPLPQRPSSRRALLGAAGLVLALPRLAAAAPAAPPPTTPAAASPSPAPAPACHPATDWAAFAARHIQPDGRVIDFNTPQQQSTSEGQSYGLFFSLIHNDRATFSRVLAWTEANLAGGSLAKQLPAWQWGRKPAGGWGVLDANAASDADLWIAYALMEAGRLWNDAGYRSLGREVLAQAVREEIINVPGLGRMLLPWPKSVASGPLWRLNPSYMPLQLLRYFQQADAAGPWGEVIDNTLRMFGAVTPKGFAPDWCAWSQDSRSFVADPQKGAIGSYDAIRVYLWAGMLSEKDPARKMLLLNLRGPRQALAENHTVPEYVDTVTGQIRGMAPLGFSGAMLPYLKALDATDALADQVARVPGGRVAPPAANATTPPPTPLPYYEQCLLLFGQAWLDGRYEFGRHGQLQTSWRTLCRPNRPAQ